jgi:hypothetical protein
MRALPSTIVLDRLVFFHLLITLYYQICLACSSFPSVLFVLFCYFFGTHFPVGDPVNDPVNRSMSGCCSTGSYNIHFFVFIFVLASFVYRTLSSINVHRNLFNIHLPIQSPPIPPPILPRPPSRFNRSTSALSISNPTLSRPIQSSSLRNPKRDSRCETEAS